MVDESSGRILVFSGLFTHALRTDDEVAALLAHELGHVLANHERESKSAIAITSPISLSFLLIHFIAETVGFGRFLSSLNILSFISVVMYSRRRQEKEADYIGMLLMTDAGFDPSAATTFHRKMQYTQDRALIAGPTMQQAPQWLSTHPSVS